LVRKRDFQSRKQSSILCRGTNEYYSKSELSLLMPVSPSQVLVYVCDKCGATATWDRSDSAIYLPPGWYELKVYNIPHSLTFNTMECMMDYVKNPPPLGTVVEPVDGPPTSTMDDS
jgi:hypothetical protein